MNKKNVENQLNTKLNITAPTGLNMNNNNNYIYNVKNPGDGGPDALSQSTFNNRLNTKLYKTASSDLNKNNKTITSLTDPSGPQRAVKKRIWRVH